MINLSLINPQLYIGTYPQNPVDLDRLKSGPKITAVLNLQTDDDFIALGVDWPRIEKGYLASTFTVPRVWAGLLPR